MFVEEYINSLLRIILHLLTYKYSSRHLRSHTSCNYCCTRRGWGVSVTPRPLFTPGKNPVPIVQEAGWAPGPVWTDAENLAPTDIRSPDRPARSQSLYRLRYPAHTLDW